jgi:hypothetical protein
MGKGKAIPQQQQIWDSRFHHFGGKNFIIFNTQIKVSGGTDYDIFFDHIGKIFW